MKIESIFESSKDTYKNSYVNWRTGKSTEKSRRFVAIGEAYFETAIKLLKTCIDDNTDRKADSWIFPVLFNTIHGIEVYLKAINNRMKVLLNEENKIIGSHDIKQLCEITISNLNSLKEEKIILDEYKTMREDLKYVYSFIKNIYEKTSDMTFARYPMSKNKDNHFYVESIDNVIINLETYHEELKNIFRILEYIYDYLVEIKDLKDEYEEEMMSYYSEIY